MDVSNSFWHEGTDTENHFVFTLNHLQTIVTQFPIFRSTPDWIPPVQSMFGPCWSRYFFSQVARPRYFVFLSWYLVPTLTALTALLLLLWALFSWVWLLIISSSSSLRPAPSLQRNPQSINPSIIDQHESCFILSNFTITNEKCKR